MLLKLGVSIHRLEHHCRKSLKEVEELFEVMEFGEPVVTSTFGGTHSPHSLHYQNRAYDIRLPSKNVSGKSTDPVELNKDAVRGIKEKLGSDFDIILEKSHIHIEYDPK